MVENNMAMIQKTYIPTIDFICDSLYWEENETLELGQLIDIFFDKILGFKRADNIYIITAQTSSLGYSPVQEKVWFKNLLNIDYSEHMQSWDDSKEFIWYGVFKLVSNDLYEILMKTPLYLWGNIIISDQKICMDEELINVIYSMYSNTTECNIIPLFEFARKNSWKIIKYSSYSGGDVMQLFYDNKHDF